MAQYKFSKEEDNEWKVCESIAEYSNLTHRMAQQLSLFAEEEMETHDGDIRVVELFAGVGGFRIGLERASKRYVTVWNNQWEPSTKRQDASIVYCRRFGATGHSNEDIATVPTANIPYCDLLCGGFPCQDYSVATTLRRSGGIEGKKGVLWWQIYRILREKGEGAPQYLMLENVDRLLVSPARQRGRDFAIILASLSDLGYTVEWRVINAAEYGMPQRRRRTYMVAYKRGNRISEIVDQTDKYKWLLEEGTMAKAFPCRAKNHTKSEFTIVGDLSVISENFNKGKKVSPFLNSGIMINRHVYSVNTESVYSGPLLTLGQMLIDEKDVPEDYFISDEDLSKWEYLKGHKSLKRVNKETGIEYTYSEGAMAFPDYLDRASRTIITGEGGPAPSRFKHVIKTQSGRYRRLVPLELERLNMFPDYHTYGTSDIRRAFLMGNALVTGIVEKIGLVLERNI
ncbi:MAG: DNA (cytosine-5-)-methyltransferase [Prevotellaceae bacterium]|nr:DNA (cytosine-5-)-methyltransferase [Prevotellaceae bacterium]